MDNAVGRTNVSSDDLGTVDEDGAACGPDRHVLALHGRQHLHVHEVLGMHGAGSHVVRQQVHELRLVLRLEQVGEDALGESGERLVGRGEDGERALTRESADEVGSLERGDEGRELWRGGSDVHDVFRSRLHHQHPTSAAGSENGWAESKASCKWHSPRGEYTAVRHLLSLAQRVQQSLCETLTFL